MKLVVVHKSFKIRGGAENLILWSLDDLQRRFPEISITLVSENLPSPAVCTAGREIALNEHIFSWPKTFYSLAGVFSGVDAVITHNFPSMLLSSLALRIFRNNSTRLYWYCHEPPAHFFDKSADAAKKRFSNFRINPLRADLLLKKAGVMMERNAVKRCTGVWANSRRTADFADEIYGIKSSVLYPGIPDYFFSQAETGKSVREETLARYGLKKNGFIISAGRLVREKKFDYLIRALSLEQNRLPALVIVGSGPDQTRLENCARECGTRKVIFTGFIPETDLDLLYRLSLFSVALPADEPFGLAVTEAMARRSIILFSSDGGAAEIINNCENGFLCNASSIRDIAQNLVKISRLIKNSPARADRIRKNAFATAENYSIKAFNDSLVKRISGRE
ncbi:MAG: hypothetical protein A2096_12450 [Spirochaetes bacterium GWF1_41_5]|nr:MAG: hypothetical protein A2096_12450 [Spirochaetes bacterium GWF1_41_5]